MKFLYTSIFQVMSKEDTETLNLCKSMMNRGECPPLMVVYDPKEGCVTNIRLILYTYAILR